MGYDLKEFNLRVAVSESHTGQTSQQKPKQRDIPL
jgi:hypothetical protein